MTPADLDEMGRVAVAIALCSREGSALDRYGRLLAGAVGCARIGMPGADRIAELVRDVWRKDIPGWLRDRILKVKVPPQYLVGLGPGGGEDDLSGLWGEIDGATKDLLKGTNREDSEQLG